MRLQKFAALFSFIIPVSNAQDTIFLNSWYDDEFMKYVESSYQDLDGTIYNWDSTDQNLQTRMTDDLIFNATTGDSALPLFLGYSTLHEDVVEKPASCELDSFGRYGNYTTAVCDAKDAVLQACIAETSCEASKIPNVVSASSNDFLLEWIDEENEIAESGPSKIRKMNLVKTAICFARALSPETWDSTIYNISSCSDHDNLPDDQDLSRRTENYWGAVMGTMHGKRNRYNPLWTNSAAVTDKAIDPNADFVIGDGRLYLAELALDAFEQRPDYSDIQRDSGTRELTYSKILVVETIVEQYTNVAHDWVEGEGFGTTDENHFYYDVVHGYFMQKYSGTIFPTRQERKAVLDGTKLMFKTACAASLGSLLSYECGVSDASELYSYVQYYFGTKSTGDSAHLISGADACSGLWKRQCRLAGLSELVPGGEGRCCRWNAGSKSCVNQIGSATCMTSYCKNWKRNLTWRAKAAISNALTPTSVQKDAASCFAHLGLN